MHIGSTPCEASHARTFYLEQRKILNNGLLKVDVDKLYDYHVRFFQEHVKATNPPGAVEFIKLQLGASKISEPRQVGDKSTPSNLFGFFANTDEKSGDQELDTKRLRVTWGI